ncbi:hypothetical protein [Fluviicola sp.]|jgi:hypothetical protein|uniref:hypothetical protein n=1 Tax=Fluviicola sp. TaxID=1917219 RepID=UPI002833A62E|nr:hypothetical protein [Fluviicola sp.]MDR0803121.1 hypothetical protein [Fluviicola sp.]
MQRKAKEQLDEYGQSIPGKFWVIYQLDGCEQLGFIYLNPMGKVSERREEKA